jgi:hypothetical protein
MPVQDNNYKISLMVLTALLTGAVFSVWAEPSAVGSLEVNLLETILTGNLGLILGLAVTILGIFRIAMGKMGDGITLCIVGVLIVLTPGVYNGIRLIVDPIVKALT